MGRDEFGCREERGKAPKHETVCQRRRDRLGIERERGLTEAAPSKRQMQSETRVVLLLTCGEPRIREAQGRTDHPTHTKEIIVLGPLMSQTGHREK